MAREQRNAFIPSLMEKMFQYQNKKTIKESKIITT